MTTALLKIDDEIIQSFDAATEKAYGSLVASGDLSTVRHALNVAAAIQVMRTALTPEVVQGILQPLAGTTLGFQVDRQGGYDDDTVRDCAIEAILNGLPLVGNRWNIIGGRFYVRKEGFEDLCGKMCRFSASVNVGTLPANAYVNGGYVTCTVTVMYSLNGSDESAEAQRHVGKYRVKLNKKSSIPEDLLEGKAKRKALRDLWRILSGAALSDSDDLGSGASPEASLLSSSGSRPDPESPADHESATDATSGHKEPLPVKMIPDDQLDEVKALLKEHGKIFADVDRVHNLGISGGPSKIPAHRVEEVYIAIKTATQEK